jgi:hypothetical protein
LSAVDRGHAAERTWEHRIEQDDPGRHSFRPRWAIVDVISMKDGETTFFDEVKTTSRPYERFGPIQRRALLKLAQECGAEARLVWWPDHAKQAGRDPQIIPSSNWPS